MLITSTWVIVTLCIVAFIGFLIVVRKPVAAFFVAIFEIIGAILEGILD